MSKDHSCRHLLGSLSDYVDGTLEESLCAEIERHMSDCEDCRIVIDSLRKTIYLYQETSQHEPMPEGVRERLYHRLALDDYLEEK
ncbi:MAG: anti-sigma factor [Anaerolineales bacterium]|jgi:anti-sigma factor RsiW